MCIRDSHDIKGAAQAAERLQQVPALHLSLFTEGCHRRELRFSGKSAQQVEPRADPAEPMVRQDMPKAEILLRIVGLFPQPAFVKAQQTARPQRLAGNLTGEDLSLIHI